MNEKCYKRLEQFMLSYMGDSAHDSQHVYRVLHLAIEIAHYEKRVDVSPKAWPKRSRDLQ